MLNTSILVSIFATRGRGTQIKNKDRLIILYIRGAQLKFHGGSNFFDTSKGQSCYVLTHSKSVFIRERSKIWGFEGQIKSFCGPHMLCMPDSICITSSHRNIGGPTFLGQSRKLFLQWGHLKLKSESFHFFLIFII